ncbi:serine hydrolase domain-containing protein [Lacipirellula limnantheis]|uniref:serine hydrolase domain-containing protein n=1 Tax=Lacipirellula limnantheis TaxID=2528024 RepID=UPI001AEF5299|nr:serine hydrolase domain-containing protein [Lacipirellula limnantheis]
MPQPAHSNQMNQVQPTCRRSNLRNIAAAIAIAVAVSPAPTRAGDASPDLIKQVAAALPDSPGACVLAVDDGQVVFQHGFGLADVANNVLCTPQTNFRMASVSKQFTATAILLLVDQGKLSLDDTLDKFFPGFPEYGKKITVKQLLTHTSGLPDYEELIPKGTTLQLGDLDVVQILLDTKEPQFAPGSQWRYSNSAFVLLGMIVEIAAEQPFHQFMKNEMFRPLGMDNSCIYQRGLNEVAHRAFGHRLEDGKWTLADQSVASATRGDGCVYTSLEDYLKLLTAHADGKLLSAASHDAMFSPQAKTTREDSSYGYGWFIDEYRGEPRIQHNGDSRGFRLCVQTFPHRRAAVVLQFNGDVNEGMMEVGQRMADLLIFDREPK